MCGRISSHLNLISFVPPLLPPPPCARAAASRGRCCRWGGKGEGGSRDLLVLLTDLVLHDTWAGLACMYLDESVRVCDAHEACVHEREGGVSVRGR